MKMHCVLAVMLVAMSGCEKQGTTVQNNQAQQQPVPILSQPDAAKAHVQQYIDRLMGGDQSVKLGLLGPSGVDFNSIDSIEIKSAVPTYTPEGQKVDNWVRVVMNVKGYDNLKRRNIERNIDRDVILKEGKWRIFGADF